MAPLLRGGLLPHALVSPAARRATRALLRRRTPLLRTRAELVAPVPHTNRQSPRPERGQQSADHAQRAGVAARCDAPAGHQPLASALAWSTAAAQRRSARALFLRNTAQPPEAQPLSLGPPGPGRGHLLRRGLRDAMPQSDRVPRGQEVAASCRRSTWAKAAGGNRWGTSGHQRGHAPRTGAFAAAAPLCRRGPAPGPKALAQGEKPPATGTARSLRAPTLARAVSGRRTRPTAGALEPGLRPEGRRAGAPGAARDPAGSRLHRTAVQPRLAASGHAAGRRGPLLPEPRALLGPALWLV
jgi:hypothetical protein